MIAHEVVHALQDEHFQLTRGAFASRPRDHDGELAAQALVEGDATEVQSRYVAALSAGDLIGELARTLGSIPSDGARRRRCPISSASSLYPYNAGQEFVKALREQRRPATARPRVPAPARGRPPPVLDPARYLAGDPPAATG